MKRIFILISVILYGYSALSQSGFNKAEYFFDTDNGPGTGFPITTPVGITDTINFSSTIPTTGLSAGFHLLALRMRHNDGRWGLFESRGVYISAAAINAGDITAAEYFFDADNGSGAGTSIAVSTGAIVNFIVPIPTSLPAGFHFLAIRVKGADGKWGLFESRGFYVTASAIDASNISAAEYFFDTDNGPGTGTAISITGGPVINFPVNIPVALSAGFHFISIRVKGTDGKWGLFEKRGFYISSSGVDVANITAAEYFFDSDTGPGTGTAIPLTAGAVVNFPVSIPVALTPGFHFIGIRVKGADNTWGLFEKRGFFISTSTTDAANITAAEYFFDADNGTGTGTAISLTAGPVVNFNVPIPVSLSNGFHFIAIRTKGADGKWGLFEKRGFYISTSTANMPVVTNAEYFFDTDPGIGNAVPLTVNTPGDNFTQSFAVPVPVSTVDGQHFLAIRVKDQSGNWGLYEFSPFTVSGAVPVTGLFFTAKKEGAHVQLDWSTLTETNTSRFDIERSINGAAFERIAQQAATGNSNTRSDYSYADGAPDKLNYYRIKQIDTDGRFIYSATRFIKFGKEQYSVYPSITHGKLNIDGATATVAIRIFNSNGRQIKVFMTNSDHATADISNVASGTYYVIIESNGGILFSQKIVKD